MLCPGAVAWLSGCLNTSWSSATCAMWWRWGLYSTIPCSPIGRKRFPRCANCWWATGRTKRWGDCSSWFDLIIDLITNRSKWGPMATHINICRINRHLLLLYEYTSFFFRIYMYINFIYSAYIKYYCVWEISQVWRFLVLVGLNSLIVWNSIRFSSDQ